MNHHHSGPAGEAWDVLEEVAGLTPDAPHGHVGFWFIHALFEPGATHEFHLSALDPDPTPSRSDPTSWRRLTPLNFIGQYAIAGDADHADSVAAYVTERAAWAITEGHLWAEPLLSGQTEPWHSALQNTIVHLRDGTHEVDHG